MDRISDARATERLVKLCGLLGSSHDGERSNAAAMADAFVRELGLTWASVILVTRVPQKASGYRPFVHAEETPWRDMLKRCQDSAWVFSDKERRFLASMATWRGKPTGPQLKWLTDLYFRIVEETGETP